MPDKNTINILGAGLAGLSAAITLAVHGRRVIVHEKHAGAGMRFHNDFQGMENWSVSEDLAEELGKMSISPGFFFQPVSHGMMLGPSARATIRSRAPLFYLIKRGSDPGSIDQALRKQALDLGVELRFNVGTTVAECDIIATGPARANIFAVGKVFETSSDDVMAGMLDDTVAPKGYAYLLIAANRGTLVVTHFKPLKDSARCLDRAVARFRDQFDFDMRDPRPFAGSGGFHLPGTAIRDGKLYAGEAAGFQDFLFGFGTRYALVSGHLAARSIIEGKDYDLLWKARFGRLLTVSALNRRIYELAGGMGYDLFVRRLARTDDPQQVMRNCYARSLLWLPFA